jgi:hypothetical protein
MITTRNQLFQNELTQGRKHRILQVGTENKKIQKERVQKQSLSFLDLSIYVKSDTKLK